MGTRPRDSQISRVTKAEQQVRQGLAPQQMPALQSRASNIARTAWFRDLATKAGRTIGGVSLQASSYHQCGHAMNGRLAILRFAPGRYTLLDLFHGLAHVVTPDDVAMHGPEFCKNLLAICQQYGSMRFRNSVRDAFKANKVKYIYKSAEAREAARKRAAEYGTPFSPKVSREEQQEELVAMMRELAGLEPEPDVEDPIERMLKAAKREIK